MSPRTRRRSLAATIAAGAMLAAIGGSSTASAASVA
jgi:hypothetical protein